ncbi:flagellar hook protein FlgE [Ruficoccus amylovorans]|uniref:Flagellar hook protein FlgE n=1 Tax=Ruficoccus amylovorans TaxID=1804625 RepID=A0A842HHH0_9BACT|nr:flagellar hook-basal body complex protein [Ruficoccus amylovorans]MBC2595014.1 flagellar hook protein FlgE [Ruficoccus amylovorans]
MGLTDNLYIGASAMQSFTNGMQAIGNNISNSKTIGYKKQDVHYSDSFGEALRDATVNGNGTAHGGIQIGDGVKVTASRQFFKQGPIDYTGVSSDLAIAGDGFFRLLDETNNVQYLTRDGSFRVDPEGYLVSQSGGYLLGLTGGTPLSDPAQLDRMRVSYTDQVKVNANGQPIDGSNRLVLADGSRALASPSSATGYFRSDADGHLLDTTGTFAPSDAVVLRPVSGNDLRAVYHELDGTSYLVNLAGNLVDANGAELDADSATAGAQALAFDPTVSLAGQGVGWSSFDLPAAVATDAVASAATWNPANPLAGQAAALPDPTDTNQVVLSLDSWNFTRDGSLIMNLSDGTSFKSGQVLLQQVQAPEMLQTLGDNQFGAIAQAGALGMTDWAVGSSVSADQLRDHLPDTGGNAVIKAQSLEQSNTDLTREFVNMITTQRAFQAGSRIISVIDEMMQETVNLKR